MSFLRQFKRVLASWKAFKLHEIAFMSSLAGIFIQYTGIMSCFVPCISVWLYNVPLGSKSHYKSMLYELLICNALFFKRLYIYIFVMYWKCNSLHCYVKIAIFSCCHNIPKRRSFSHNNPRCLMQNRKKIPIKIHRELTVLSLQIATEFTVEATCRKTFQVGWSMKMLLTECIFTHSEKHRNKWLCNWKWTSKVKG